MSSVVSLLTFANSSSVPIVVFVDMQQEHLAKPRLLAFAGIDRAPDNCRKEMVFERSARSCYSSKPFTVLVNQNVANLCDAPASHALDDMSADNVDRAVSRISGLHGDVYETAEWTASTLPRKLGNGINAGG